MNLAKNNVGQVKQRKIDFSKRDKKSYEYSHLEQIQRIHQDGLVESLDGKAIIEKLEVLAEKSKKRFDIC